jgi:hypothetical protein
LVIKQKHQFEPIKTVPTIYKWLINLDDTVGEHIIKEYIGGETREIHIPPQKQER